jgi:hypothetical protein
MFGSGVEPVPLDAAPECGDFVAELRFLQRVAGEVAACGKESFHKEGGFDEVGAVVVEAEVGSEIAGPAAEEMRPCSLEAVGAGEIVGDAKHAVDDLVAGSEAALGTNNEGYGSETAGADGYEVGVARDGFEGHTSVGFGAIPVVLKGGLLHHGQ